MLELTPCYGPRVTYDYLCRRPCLIYFATLAFEDAIHAARAIRCYHHSQLPWKYPLCRCHSCCDANRHGAWLKDGLQFHWFVSNSSEPLDKRYDIRRIYDVETTESEDEQHDYAVDAAHLVNIEV